MATRKEKEHIFHENTNKILKNTKIQEQQIDRQTDRQTDRQVDRAK